MTFAAPVSVLLPACRRCGNRPGSPITRRASEPAALHRRAGTSESPLRYGWTGRPFRSTNALQEDPPFSTADRRLRRVLEPLPRGRVGAALRRRRGGPDLG